jgi:rhomboid protease GluP
LWNYILGGHTGKNGDWGERNIRLATGTRLARLNKTWPFPVIEFYLGNRSAAEMMSAASTPSEQCEAQFYLGERHLLRGNRAAATTHLRVAASTCPKNFYEYHGATAELKRIQ